MFEFILYFALPVLVAIVGVCGYYAIVEAKETALAEVALPQQPAPIHDASFYMKNGHWIFGVRSQDEMLDDAELDAVAGRLFLPNEYRCHAEHNRDCGV